MPTAYELLVKISPFWKLISSRSSNERFPSAPLGLIQKGFSAHVRALGKSDEVKPESSMISQINELLKQPKLDKQERETIIWLLQDLKRGSTDLISLIRQHAQEDLITPEEAANNIVDDILPNIATQTDTIKHTDIEMDARVSIHETGPEPPPSIEESFEFAVQQGNATVVEMLFEEAKKNGVKLNLDDALPAGWTPLMIAASQGYLNIVEILIREGAKVDITLLEGDSALELAQQNGHKDVARLLYIENTIQTSPLFSAAEILLNYFENTRNAESKESDAVSPIIKKMYMMFYIKMHPNFAKEVFNKNNDEINILIKNYAEQNPQEMDSFIMNLKPKHSDEYLRHAFKNDPKTYLTYHCNQKVNAIRKQKEANAMFQPNPTIEQYKSILKLDINTQGVIVEHMKKHPDYIETYFAVKKIYNEINHDLMSGNTEKILTSDFHDDPETKVLAEYIKNLRDQLLGRVFFQMVDAILDKANEMNGSIRTNVEMISIMNATQIKEDTLPYLTKLMSSQDVNKVTMRFSQDNK